MRKLSTQELAMVTGILGQSNSLASEALKIGMGDLDSYIPIAELCFSHKQKEDSIHEFQRIIVCQSQEICRLCKASTDIELVNLAKWFTVLIEVFSQKREDQHRLDLNKFGIILGFYSSFNWYLIGPNRDRGANDLGLQDCFLRGTEAFFEPYKLSGGSGNRYFLGWLEEVKKALMNCLDVWPIIHPPLVKRISKCSLPQEGDNEHIISWKLNENIGPFSFVGNELAKKIAHHLFAKLTITQQFDLLGSMLDS